ncbi:uncharacterized protein LOC126425269 [Schistocerca serialis cubense]|uniref:uncharacterized protein LOC126425269 n=1 Tax=Schistocerca serialis cubense TaxID=2023355 RepID=UPI00214F5354|nr:uncharacterized protein LOC126425269 [Schistocerca serialis cubense]
MNPTAVLPSLLALLVANGSSVLDCLCSHIIHTKHVGRPWGGTGSPGAYQLWFEYCHHHIRLYTLSGTSGTLEPPSAAVPAVAHLAAGLSSYGPPPPPAGGVEGESCASALAALHRLTWTETNQLSQELGCRVAAECLDSCSAPRLNDVEWNETALQTDHLRRYVLSQSVHAVQRITRAIHARGQCESHYRPTFMWRVSKKTDLQVLRKVYLEQLSSYYRDFAQLFSVGVTHLSRLFIPLAFEYMGNHTTDRRLHGWIKDMERVRDMMHMKLSSWVHDVQAVSEKIARYEIEDDKNRPGFLIIRRPLLNDKLLYYQPKFLFFREDFSALCEERQSEASQMFGLADALYAFYYTRWYTMESTFKQQFGANTDTVVDEEWQLEDRSNATLTVDTDCIQLLVNALDHPTCPLEDLPLETTEQREQCRVQLWDDMVLRSTHIPVTSYLAYTQRANVNLCLMAWMAVNSLGICHDVPFSMIQSVHDAACYFGRPDDQSCLQSNATHAICSVSRAILLLKCSDFFSHKPQKMYGVTLYPNGSYSAVWDDIKWQQGFYRRYGKSIQIALNYKDSLNNATLKYKDLKISSLKSLEISFIAINIFFRSLTAGVYMYLPQLRNLPGKIFLSFQITGIIQILCSDIVYRMAGVPDLSTAVLIDTALTLLSCIWLNSFCYQMYACVRHLKLPNDLLPDEARNLFRRQVLIALIPWGMVCTATIALEKTSKYHLLYSRIIFLIGILVSVSFNLVCLGLVGYMFLRTKRSMAHLRIYSNDKFGSKKEILFTSVKTVFLSGLGVIVRIGFHQAQGIAQFVYYLHISTMMQGPLLFVLFICNGTTFPTLKNRILACLNPDIIIPGEELCSAAERNLATRNNEQPVVAQSSL